MNEPEQNGEAAPEKPRRHGYEKVLRALEGRWKRRALDRGRVMNHIIEVLWETFGGKTYSWVGFYLPSPDGKGLTLGPHRDKPACSPIGLHGVCGKAIETRVTQVVPDVKALGAAHIECDPKNLSEICVPVLTPDGVPFAVLDVDSEALGAFDEVDQRWLERIVRLLTESPAPRAMDRSE